MDDAPQESEPFADVVTVAPYVRLADLGVQGEEAFHTSGLRENVGCMATFRCFSYYCRFEFKYVLVSEKVHATCGR